MWRVRSYTVTKSELIMISYKRFHPSIVCGFANIHVPYYNVPDLRQSQPRMVISRVVIFLILPRIMNGKCHLPYLYFHHTIEFIMNRFVLFVTRRSMYNV